MGAKMDGDMVLYNLIYKVVATYINIKIVFSLK